MFFTKRCSSCSFASTFAFSFSFTFFFSSLGDLQTVWTAKYTRCRPCPKTRSFTINVTLLTSYFVNGPLWNFVFSIILYDEGSVRFRRVCSLGLEDSPSNFSAYRTIPQTLCSMLQVLYAVTFIPWRERELVSLSLWASFRSFATKNINVAKLSLNGHSLWCVVTCVAFHLSLVSCSFGSRISAFLLCLSSFSRATSARYWFRLWVSLMADIGNMSIQASRGRFRCSENFPIYLTISMFSLLARMN